MGGFLGIGNSSAKTDRGAQLGARQGLWNIFGYGLPQGQQQQTAGQQTIGQALQGTQQARSTLQQPASYWQRLLTGGRPDIAQLSAPSVNAAQAGSDAAARQAATFGTSRTGGATAVQAEAPQTTQKNIDDIINQNLMGGRAAGAKGLEGISQQEGALAGQQAQIGDVQLANSLRLLGLSDDAINQILGNATTSRQISQNIMNQNFQEVGQLAGAVLGGFA